MARRGRTERRPSELTLQDLEREAKRLMRAADLEERKNAARTREVEALKAEIEILSAIEETLRRELDAGPIALEPLHERVRTLGEVLDRIRQGLEPAAGKGSISAIIAAPGAPPAERAAEDPEPPA